MEKRVKIDWGMVITGMGIVLRSESLSFRITQKHTDELLMIYDCLAHLDVARRGFMCE